jgi:putative hydrolase of the HAD superfamily
MTIAAVVFDLFETLISESELQPTRAGSLGATLGLDDRAYRGLWKTQRPRIVVGDISFADALVEISRTLGGRVDPDRVRRIVDQRVREKAAAYARIHARIAALITTLRDSGVRLAVISNGFAEDVVGWPQCALAQAFHCAVFSCKERVAKPDPAIYLRAVQRLGVEPERTAYIGDGGDAELAGAERAGLRPARAAWFVPQPHQPGPWPELENPDAVLKFVAGG